MIAPHVDTWGFNVNRWHAHPCIQLRNSGDTTDAHQGRCVRLACYLFPGDDGLALFLAHHDTTEGGPDGLGDAPFPAKRGELGEAHVRAERDVMLRRGFDFVRITEELADRAKLVDRLDAYRWAFTVASREQLDTASGPHVWDTYRKDILVRAKRLGVYEAVLVMLP